MTAPNASNAVPETPQPNAPPAASAPAGSSPAPEPWRAPPTAPAWAAGKTAEEILAQNVALAEELQRRTQPAAPTPAPTMPTDDMWISRPSDAAAQIADARAAQLVAPAMEGLKNMANLVAGQTRGLAAQQFQTEFTKWGAEIDAAMATVPVEQRTLDNYEKVVKYVRGNHVEEYAMERAKQMMANGGLGERSGGNPGAPGTPAGTFDASKLAPGFSELCARHGVTEATVQDWCRRTGTTVEKWMNDAQNNKVFTSQSPFSWEMRDDQLGITRNYGE